MAAVHQAWRTTVHKGEGSGGLSLGKMEFLCNILIEKQKKLEYTLNSLLIFFQQEKQKATINLRKKQTVTQSHGSHRKFIIL